MTALEVRGIVKRFGDLAAVDDVSFRVEPGEIYGFIGPNGAGKTTTMRICATLELPDEGDVFIEGHSVLEEPRKVRERLGFMPDAYGAYTATSVLDYLDFFARSYGLRGKKRLDTLREVIDFTGLGTLSSKLTSSLSKGMRQRLCLAKTLLHDPATLILDEPAAGLDPRARVELRELVRALADMGKAVLISSHILTELSEVCTGIAVIEAGRIQATGSVEDIVRKVRSHSEVFVKALAPADELQRVLLETPGVSGLRPRGEGFLFDYGLEQEALAGLLERLVRAGVKPVEFAPSETNLEDLFLHLTEGKVQ